MQSESALGWARTYRRENLRADVLAGIVVWTIVVPQAVAYAQIAGLPPQAGLIAAPGALLGYALLGSSRSLVVGATSSTAVLSAAAVGAVAGGDTARFVALSAAFALVAAAIFAVGALLGIGGVADLISKPILTGFLFGLGLTIALGQLPKVLGVEAPTGGFFEKLWELLGRVDSASGATVTVGVASIAVLVGLRRYAPGVPASLVLVAGAVAVSALLGLDDHGVATVGNIPRAYPKPELPDVDAGDLAALLPGALGAALVGYAESISVARGAAAAGGYSILPNRELLGLGGANGLAGITGGFVQGGGASQTAAAARAGGKTQLASIVAAGLVLLTGVLLAPLIEPLPQATLGAIVLVAVAGFFRVGEMRRFAHLRRSALVLALTALLGVLILGILRGLLLAVVLSIALLVRILSRPLVTTHLEGETLTVHVEGPLFYANAVHVKERLLAETRESGARTVVLSLAQSPGLDVEAVDTLSELEEALRAQGVELTLTGVRPAAARLLRRSGLSERMPVELDLT